MATGPGRTEPADPPPVAADAARRAAQDGDPPPVVADAARRAAQDGAAELARMGIDPRALGLEPLPDPGRAPGPGVEPAPPAGPESSRTVRGVAAPPAATRSRPDRGPAPEPGPAWLDSSLSRPIAAVGPPPAPAAGGGPVGALERIVPRPAPGPAHRWRELLRTVTLGLVEPSAAAAAEQERQLLARVRRRCPEPRVIAFLAGKGGVGTSTTAAGVAVTLAGLRPDSAALVSARSGAGSLGQRLLGQPAPAAPDLVDGGPGAAPLWVRDRLAVVDGSPWHSPVPAGTLLRLLELLRSRHPLTLIDVGNDLGEPADRVLGRADQIVLVTSASPDAVAATRTVLSRVHQIDPFRLATVVVAVVCLSRRQHQRTARQLRTELGLQAARIVPVGFDPWLAAGDGFAPERLRATTRRAYLELAGLVVDPGGAEQWFSQPPAGRGAGR